MKTILAIGAHPDDIEFGCGGILLKEQKKGNEIHLLVLSRGEAGSRGKPEEREQEAHAAAKLMGAEITFLEMGGDCHIEENTKNRFQIAAKIREIQPDIVLTLTLQENQHPDHARVGKMTRNACRFARYGGLKELKNIAPHSVSQLYYYAVSHEFTKPDIVIDISSVHEKWNAVMKCHHSQVTNENYLELQNARAKLLGVHIGVQYAMGLYVNDPIQVENMSDIELSTRCF